MSTAPAIYELLDERTLQLIEGRKTTQLRRRGWLMRRMLLAADLVGLSLAFLLVEYLYVHRAHGDRVKEIGELTIFFLSLPAWIVLAKLYGLYDRDEERTDHTTAEDMKDVFHLITVCVFLLLGFTALTGVASPTVPKLFSFWCLAITFVALARMSARSYCRRHISYLQNTVIVGAGTVGQLVARKLTMHREYGINVVGFVDDNPRERRDDLDWLVVLGSPSELPEIVRLLDVERVIFAFSAEPHETDLELIRALDGLGVQVDIVPRLFEVVTPTSETHSIEGLPVLSLRPTKIPRSSRAIKRTVDLVVSGALLVVLAPVFAFVAWRIKRDDGGPVFFRQTRLGEAMREFTVLKFRSMRTDTTSAAHEEHMRRTSNGVVAREANGLFKLERQDAITPTGRWLRRTSLDELPQLINVFRGEMSLVGPRPCLSYELQHFDEHHFDRFAMPAGITGLWQVTARAHSTFREALDMDVAYVRSWSLGLDLRLLFRTPLQLLRPEGTR
jgi:exopolysaccharide biosynthesis polyprenyl glycosylphosphotransferase